MTLDDFKAALTTVDPNAKRYTSALRPNYTVWHEFGTNDLHAGDGVDERVWKIQIDRFTKAQGDDFASAIMTMLDEKIIAYDYQLVTEPNTGYIHHIWICEVV